MHWILPWGGTLKDDGFLVLTCPDLQSVCALIAEDKLVDPLYESPAGAVAPIDILFGHRMSIARGNHFMAHKCGFTEKVLKITLLQTGFRSLATLRRGMPHLDLWVIATRHELDQPGIDQLKSDHFPQPE